MFYINIIIYWYIYDILLLILEPLILTYNQLLQIDYMFNDNPLSQNIKTYYYNRYIITDYNNKLSSINTNIYPDILTIENNTITYSTQIYCTVILAVPLILWIFLKNYQRVNMFISFLFFYYCTILYNHFIIIPFKINQILNDYIETEYIFNFQLTLDFYIRQYFFTLIIAIILFIVTYYLLILQKDRKYTYLFIFIYTYLIITIDFNNSINSIMNINLQDITIIAFFYIMLYEILYYINIYTTLLEMTGIEPA